LDSAKITKQVSPHKPHQESDWIDLEFDESNIQQLWSEESLSHREFRYAHPQSSLEFIIKVSRMGGKTVIMGVAVGDDKTTSFDFKTEDFTSAAFFPWSKDKGQDIAGGFIVENRLKDLSRLFKINILQKLIPGLSKSGYLEEQTTTSTDASSLEPYISPIFSFNM
jgi:proteasome inhibitor subunit 1 (PI31)